MYLDYWYQKSTHLSELITDTKREAELLAQAAFYLAPDDAEAVQALVDRASEVLRSEEPARRDLAVASVDGKLVLPSGSQVSASHITDMLQRTDAATPTVTDDWVFSSAAVKNLRIYVFCDAAEARAISTEHALWRVAEIGVLGLLATGLINLLLMRLVIRPFTRLAQTIQRIGKGDLGATTGEFRSREFQTLAEDLNHMSRALAQAEHERGLQMSKAGRLQARLRSDGVLVPGLEIVHWHKAADHVAGDYFDVLRCPDGSWLICIADVTGHGVAAAMGAAILKTLLWSAVESGGDLDCIVRGVNKRFGEVTLEEDFASLMMIHWMPEASELHYANAGHETAFLLDEDLSSKQMESTGTLVGIAHDEAWEVKTLTVTPGSRLVLYTDGITEARSPDGDLFGRDRLKQLIHNQSNQTIQGTIDVIVEALRAHLDGIPADDDLTLVGLHFSRSPGIAKSKLEASKISEDAV